MLHMAQERLQEMEAQRGSTTEGEDAMAAVESSRLSNTTIIERVFSITECDQIVGALRRGVAMRGGWDTDRHSKYPTMDVPLAVAGAEVEHLVRCAIFARVLKPLAARYYGASFLPEHLCFRDVFFVRYHACEAVDESADAQSEGAAAQSSLSAHTDGSTFSFNVALSSQGLDFEGGGTFLEEDGRVIRPARGSAVAHGGQVRHGGLAVTRGERLILVGFVGSEAVASRYSSRLARWASFHAYCKFGEEAWRRPSTKEQGTKQGMIVA